jgi:hypothetical protein
LVLSSETRSIAEIQDLALFRVRPMFASLPGVSAPPPFGGSARSIVVTVDPNRLQSYGMSPEEAVTALVKGNSISPSGNIPIGDQYPVVPVNSVVKEAKHLESIPIRTGDQPVYLRDIGQVEDSADAPVGFALADGRRAVYILATKRADASTLSVINEIKNALPRMKDALGPEGEGIDVRFEFDLSLGPIVAATDYMKAVPDTIARWIDRPFTVGECSTVSDYKDNIHWFQAASETAFIFNIHVMDVRPGAPAAADRGGSPGRPARPSPRGWRNCPAGWTSSFRTRASCRWVRTWT